ncbi:ATP-binding protein [Paucibacter sp. R3-3]|uniref:histidine kinase n=1 Tax=Roseateles agri TaxID=3098619 RepID=A0ABU5DIH5_9BURK|nr:ATP-binding protein [Paucibacter sp. R3-3]MDY0746104.1 ATP-binding protein [Paucibacter sp. R3-3]
MKHHLKHELTPEELAVLKKLHRRRQEMWHQHWNRRVRHGHARFKYSLVARLIATFVLLAVLGSLIVYGAVDGHYDALWAVPLLLLVLGAAFAAVGRMIWPLRMLARAAQAYGRGDFGFRMPVLGNDEIGDLTRRFNDMATDIQAMLDGKRALLLAISHELRSPLTRARLHAELIEEGASRDALLKDLGEMRVLIEALLESERLGAGHSALQLQAVDLAALVRAQEGVDVQIEPGLPLLQLDPLRLQLLLRNLVENAKRHNDASRGPVIVSLRREGQVLLLSVRDHGPGVPAEALEHLGEPFFRPDAARTRNDGGVGLGLNLCKMIAAAHGGRLEIRNVTPGLEVTLNLPIT